MSDVTALLDRVFPEDLDEWAADVERFAARSIREHVVRGVLAAACAVVAAVVGWWWAGR